MDPCNNSPGHCPVVIVTSFMGDLRRSGGVARHIMLLEEGFKRLGYEVKIINRSSLGPLVALLLSLPKAFDRLIPCLGTGLWAITAPWSMRLLVWLRHRGPALWVFEDAYGFLPDKQPHVLIIHSLESEVKQTLQGSSRAGAWGISQLRRRELEALARAQHAATVSTQYARVIKEETSHEVQVIPNAIDIGPLAKAAAPDSRLRLMAIGNLDERKNFSFLLPVMEQMAALKVDAHLTIIGVGPLKNSLAREISQRGLQELVTLTGFVEEPDLYYSQAQILLHPSLHETFGLVLLEARRHGLVTLVSNNICVPDDLCDHKLPHQAEAWAKCLEKYAQEQGLATEVGLRGYLVAKEQYSLETAIKGILGLMTD